MLLRQDIEAVYNDQQARLSVKSISTPREYISIFKPTGNFIEIISGIRRCGKSTLLRQIIENQKLKYCYFNFEDSRIIQFEANDFDKLDKIIGDEVHTYFFDEIQNVKNWEIFIRQLHERGEKIYITGSNATLLSKELGTRLTGRNIRHELFPFSYSENLIHLKKENNLLGVSDYMSMGGFPSYLDLFNIEILQTLLQEIVLRDIAIRYGIKNTDALLEIVYHLISNIGKPFTFNGLKKQFSIGSANSISDYLSWLKDAYLFFYVQRFDWSLKRRTIYPRKVYCIDNGMITTNSTSFTKDSGRLFENMIFLHLRRHFDEIYYFQINRECDFIIMENKKCSMAIQVTESLHSENKEREIEGLIEAMNYFKLNSGIIVTMEIEDLLEVEGKKIQILPSFKFLIGNSYLNN